MSRDCTLPLRMASTRRAESHKPSTKVSRTSTNSGNSTVWMDMLSLPAGEGGEARSAEPGGVSLHCRRNSLHHPIQLPIDFRIGETKNFVTDTAQLHLKARILLCTVFEIGYKQRERYPPPAEPGCSRIRPFYDWSKSETTPPPLTPPRHSLRSRGRGTQRPRAHCSGSLPSRTSRKPPIISPATDSWGSRG